MGGSFARSLLPHIEAADGAPRLETPPIFRAGRGACGHGLRPCGPVQRRTEGRLDLLRVHPPEAYLGLCASPRGFSFIRLKAAPGGFQGISPVSNGTYGDSADSDTICLSGETEPGSAGTQPGEGYPGSGAPMARQAPDGSCRQGPFSSIPLDTGSMPKKIPLEQPLSALTLVSARASVG